MRSITWTLGFVALLAGCNSSDEPDAQAGASAAPTETALASLDNQREAIAGHRPGGGTPSPLPPSSARDPGPRNGQADAGSPIAGLSPAEVAAFNVSLADFAEAEEVDEGLGPTMNLDSCGGCHMQPSIGGTSPKLNPQVAFANAQGAKNKLPSFITADGPVREARFIRKPDGSPDGGVHGLFTIAGRSDAPGCNLAQPDFAREVARGNVIFRIPTPVFGAGLIEQISDRDILINQVNNLAVKRQMGIRGRTNTNGNDGTVTRFGWKAQNKSLLIFSGEAYNVEMGITSEAFQNERNETPECQFASVPNDITPVDAATPLDAIGAIEKFAIFMRFLAPPTPSATLPGGAASIVQGKALFNSVGCALCHTPALRTGNSNVAALRDKPVDLFSDLLLHDMGEGLSDGISQGLAGAREFRTAPLWGLGQRLFFLHDGRTSDLRSAIAAHRSQGSEANSVINNYIQLTDAQEQNLLNFLRSL